MIDIKHVAKLARLGLTDEEEKKFGKDLSAILDFVDKLSEAKTDGVESISQITGLTNVTRSDEGNQLSEDKSVKEGILINAPACEGGYFKVKRILE